MTTNKKNRKETPIFRGALMYFPDAIAAVANCSYVANEHHNPGQPMHWAREKSDDHEDCLVRHLLERGKVDTDGIRHSVKVAWRALAMVQLEIEKDQKPKVKWIQVWDGGEVLWRWDGTTMEIGRRGPTPDWDESISLPDDLDDDGRSEINRDQWPPEVFLE